MDAQTHAQQPFEGSTESSPAQDQHAGRLDLREPGDCLALIQHTFGGVPTESLIVIGLLSGFTGGHMRIDLRPALQGSFSAARLIAECLAGEGAAPAPEAAMVVLHGDCDPSPDQDRAWRACLDALRMVLEAEYCVPLVQEWFLAAGHIRDPRCADPACCALPGRRTEDLRIPVLGGPGDGSSRPEPWPLERAAQTFLEQAPEADAALAEITRRSRHEAPVQSSPEQQRGGLEAWDTALRTRARSRARAEGHRPPDLLPQLRTGAGRDLLIPLAAVGLQPALIRLQRDQRSGEAPADPDGQQMLRDCAASFLGQTGRRPDWDRVDALEQVLAELVPYARDAERENILCLMAWIEWARGRGTAAGAFIDQCLLEFPHNQFSRLIDRLMQVQGVCLWARVKQHSWSWTRSRTASPAPSEKKSPDWE